MVIPKQSKSFVPRNFVLNFAVFIAVVVAIFSWSIASPPGSSPDDDFHLPSIWCAWGEQAGICEPTNSPNTRYLPAELVQSTCIAYKPNESASCQQRRDLTVINGMTETARGNFDKSYPPVFYSIMRFFVVPNFQESILAMRLFSAIVFAVVGMMIWSINPGILRRILPVAWAVTAVPLTISILASNNPSSWAIFSIVTCFATLFGFYTSKGWRSGTNAGLFALFAFVGSGTRADAGINIVIVSLVSTLFASENVRKYWFKLLLPLFMVPFYFYFYSTSQGGAVASTGLAESAPDSLGLSAQVGLLSRNIIQLPGLWASSFGLSNFSDPVVALGHLGWLDTVMPMIVWIPALCVFVGVGFTGLGFLNLKKISALALLFVGLTFIPLYVLQLSKASVGSTVQPRYLLPLLVVFAAATIWPVGPISLSLGKFQITLLVASLGLANSIALFVQTYRYVSGLKGFDLSYLISPKWWWDEIAILPIINWGFGSLAFLTLLIIGRSLVSKPLAS